MTHAFKRYLSWPNNKHYPVMYSVLFYQCWQCETCERTQGAAAAMCGRRHLGCYINFNYFHGTCVVLFFVVWSWPFWPYEFCAWPGCFFYDDWAIYFWLLPLIFSWTFFSKLLYCIPAYLISLLLDYHQYILCCSSNLALGDVYNIMW